MTPDEFRAGVLGDVLAAWETGCFCANPGFRKLLAFNYEDYGIWPTGLADSEILIDEIIRRRFHLDGPTACVRPTSIVSATSTGSP